MSLSRFRLTRRSQGCPLLFQPAERVSPEPRRSSLIEGFALMSSSFDAMQCVRRDTRRAWCRHAGMDATAAMVKWAKWQRETPMFRFRVANFNKSYACHAAVSWRYSRPRRRHELFHWNLPREDIPCAAHLPAPSANPDQLNMSAFTVTRNPVAFRSLTTNVSRGRSVRTHTPPKPSTNSSRRLAPSQSQPRRVPMRSSARPPSGPRSLARP